jgi:DASS family divalent anion:Na+ symporter
VFHGYFNVTQRVDYRYASIIGKSISNMTSRYDSKPYSAVDEVEMADMDDSHHSLLATDDPSIADSSASAMSLTTASSDSTREKAAVHSPPKPLWLQLWSRPPIQFAFCLACGLTLFMLPRPSGLSVAAWFSFSVFVSTILGFLLHPYPMGFVCLFSLCILGITHTLTAHQLLRGYGDDTVWLVIAAFLLASAVEKTGLGKRIALIIMVKLGKSMLGLGYALVVAEAVLALIVPSNTARGGGLLAPIVFSLVATLPPDNWRARAFLILTGAHANLISAAYCLTGSAPNVLVTTAAERELGITFGWFEWLRSGIVPAIVSFATLPPLVYFLCKVLSPKDKALSAADAQRQATVMLRELGAIKRSEWLLVAVFAGLITTWAGVSQFYKIDMAISALAAVVVLLMTNVLTWDDILQQKQAYDTLFWLGGILALGEGLSDVGFLPWLADQVHYAVRSMDLSSKVGICIVLALFYFFSMYSFSMITAHITCFVPLFMRVGKLFAVPPFLMTALLAHTSCLSAALTTYSTGPVIIYFGHGIVSTPRWFIVGGCVGCVHVVVWVLTVGLLWWNINGWT